MTVKLSSLKANLAREIDGDWVDHPKWKGVRFNVSSFHKPSYKTARDSLNQRLVKNYGGSLPDMDVLRPHYAQLYVDELLHGWEGFDVPYTPEGAVQILSDPAYREVFDAVEWCAGRIATIDAEYVERTGKNSEPRFAGASMESEQAAG